MADLDINSTVALTMQVTADTYVAPSSSTDGLPCSNLRVANDPFTIQNPEYTGTVHSVGDIVTGKGHTVSFNVALRGPGGASPPAADAFVLGRLFKACGFTENIISTAVPAAPEAIGAAPGTSSLTLGATAVGTLDLYKGLLIFLSHAGVATSLKSYSALRSYSAAKLATLAETFGTTIAGNWQLPKQIAYQLSTGSTIPNLCTRTWRGNKRYDGVNMAVSGFKLNFPTSNRDQTAFPTLDVTLVGDLVADYDEAAPTLAAPGAIPLFRDGDFWLGNKSLGGSSFSIDVGPTVGFPPNANKTNGNDAGQITRTRRSGSVEITQVAKTVFDPMALADAQAKHAIWAQYGLTVGNMVSAIVTDARLSYPQDTTTGEFIGNSIDVFIDGANKDVSVIFPYPA